MNWFSPKEALSINLAEIVNVFVPSSRAIVSGISSHAPFHASHFSVLLLQVLTSCQFSPPTAFIKYFSPGSRLTRVTSTLNDSSMVAELEVRVMFAVGVARITLGEKRKIAVAIIKENKNFLRAGIG